jgi:hypothetical protein
MVAKRAYRPIAQVWEDEYDVIVTHAEMIDK